MTNRNQNSDNRNGNGNRGKQAGGLEEDRDLTRQGRESQHNEGREQRGMDRNIE